MNRLDLIIDALEDALDECVKPTTTKVTEALAAARELKALQPVLWKHSGDGWSYEKPLFPATPLYALDEVTK
jgi:hypothetical protein